jgi:hypothetical protein
MLDEFFMASLELKCFDWAKLFLKLIDHQQPKSIKSFRALGILYEADGNSGQS